MQLRYLVKANLGKDRPHPLDGCARYGALQYPSLDGRVIPGPERSGSILSGSIPQNKLPAFLSSTQGNAAHHLASTRRSPERATNTTGLDDYTMADTEQTPKLDNDTRTGIDTLAYAIADQAGALRLAHMSAEYLAIALRGTDMTTFEVVDAASRQLVAAIKLVESTAESLLSWISIDAAELLDRQLDAERHPVAAAAVELPTGWPS